jgi:hypothetical protein
VGLGVERLLKHQMSELLDADGIAQERQHSREIPACRAAGIELDRSAIGGGGSFEMTTLLLDAAKFEIRIGVQRLDRNRLFEQFRCYVEFVLPRQDLA